MSIIVIVIIVLLLFLAEEWWNRHASRFLEYDAELSTSRAEIDEPFELISSLKNTKALPILFAKVILKTPGKLAICEEQDAKNLHVRQSALDGQAGQLDYSTFMMPREELLMRIKVSLGARGRYLFTSATVVTGDLVGLSSRQEVKEMFREIVILPKSVEAPLANAALGSYLGQQSVNRYLYPDPVLIRGFNEYTGREPMRSISWSRSLRSGELMVKDYDFTSDLTATILLNLELLVPQKDNSILEEAISYARFCLEFLEDRKIQYDLLTNGLILGQERDGRERIARGQSAYGPMHLLALLEMLGRIGFVGARTSAFSLEELLEGVYARHEMDRLYILVTPPLSASQADSIRQWEKKRGQQMLVIVPEVKEL